MSLKHLKIKKYLNQVDWQSQNLGFNIKLSYITLLIALKHNNFQPISMMNKGVSCSITRVNCAINRVGSRILVLGGQIKGQISIFYFNFRARNIIC